MISKIKIDGKVFENPHFIGFGAYGERGDGFLIVIENNGRKYALAPTSGKVYDVIEKGSQLFAEIPYGGGRVYRAPLRFKL